jgi:hypothetical protein
MELAWSSSRVRPDPQSKLALVILDFHFDLLRLCVPE